LTVKEMTDVITKAPADLQTLLLIGAYTGMRLADACLLRWDSISFDDGIIDYEPLKTARKGKRIRVPMSPHLAARLKYIHRNVTDGERFVLPAIARQYKAERAGVSGQIQAHFNACGIATQEVPPEGSKVTRAVCRVGFHSLRHSFVSLCAANRVPQVAVMEMVGHGSPAMTRLYSHAGDDQKRDAVELLPALLTAGKTGSRKKSPTAQDHARPAPQSALAASPASQ
jgi:integrase/recombinase XerC